MVWKKGIVHARTVHEFMARLLIDTYRYGDGTAQAKFFSCMLQLGKYTQQINKYIFSVT